MATDPSRRIAKWNAKYDTTRIKAVLDEMRPDMYARVQAVFPLLTAMESQVKQVLDLQGIKTINYPWYLNFGREVWKLQRQEISGETLAVEVATLIAKWAGRGLSQTLLEIIRTGVFNVGAPAGP
jgi:hypothetical protein